MARITLDGIAHAYGGKPRSEQDYALKPLHHVWEQGMAYALLGPSGCGKTTLLNIISGLVIPSEGRLLFDDIDVTHLPTKERNIAQVFQFPVIYDTMTVAENLAFPLKNRRLPKAAIERRVTEIAAMLDLTGVLNRRARGLTADAKQKISLGRGLVRSDVSAVLFDEPLTVIDPTLKWELRSKLKAVHRALDLLMIYVTHDQIEALTFADKVVVMNEGKAVQIGTPDDLFERPEHTFVGYFIGSPGMNLMPAKVSGSRAFVDGAELQLGAAYSEPPNGRRVQVGVRPDYTELSSMAGVPVQVRRVADLGRKRLAYVTLGGQQIVATIPPEMSSIGDQAQSRVRSGAHARLRGRYSRHGSSGMTGKPINNRAWLFVLPVLAFVLFSSIIPVMTVVNYSIQDSMGVNNFFWNGDAWFRALLDPSTEIGARFNGALFRTLGFSLTCLLIEVPLGIAIALCMPRKGWLVGLSLVLMALPMLIPWTVVGTMWQIFTRQDIGLFGAALTGLGLHYNVTQDPISAWVTIVVIDVWHWTPLVILLSYAGLRAIPDAFYQAAQIDGASRWAIFFNIELPKLQKVLVIAVLLRFMQTFMIYTEPVVVTGGGPGNATTFLSIDLVKLALGQVDLGNAAAMSLVYYLITLTVCWVFYTIMTQIERRRDA